MRLVRVIATLEPGGAQLGVLRMCGALHRRGIESLLLAGEELSGAGELFERAGVAVDVWGGCGMQYALSDEFAAWLAPRLEDADLVHAHMLGGWWAAAHAIPHAVPLAASEHNAIQWPGPGPLPWESLRAAAARIDRFFAHGPAARRFALELGVPEERVRAGASPVLSLDARPRPGLPPGRVVFIGRLHREKGPDVLIDALAQMASPPPAYVLGSGPMEEELRARVREQGLEESVRFCGWQADPGAWLAGAGACAVPSRFDAWSQAAVLAMGYGVPVVASAVEGLPEVAGGGRALLVEPEDPAALAAALDDVLAGRSSPDLEAARAYAARFTAVRVAGRYAREYAELVALASGALTD